MKVLMVAIALCLTDHKDKPAIHCPVMYVLLYQTLCGGTFTYRPVNYMFVKNTLYTIPVMDDKKLKCNPKAPLAHTYFILSTKVV